ncbi:hypothetical protein PM082_008562 [Marasmius tenuissimus]|nr:hypothetical protein PM082_008562 [Marasmius tenuissimus]
MAAGLLQRQFSRLCRLMYRCTRKSGGDGSKYHLYRYVVIASCSPRSFRDDAFGNLKYVQFQRIRHCAIQLFIAKALPQVSSTQPGRSWLK